MNKYVRCNRAINKLNNTINSLLITLKENPLLGVKNGTVKRISELRIEKAALIKWKEDEYNRDKIVIDNMTKTHNSIVLKGWI